MIFDEIIKQTSGIIAGIISMIAYLPYFYSIIKGKTKPSRSSWWIWSLVGFIILVSYYDLGARNTIWIPIVFFICPLAIAFLSIKYGANKGLKKLDLVSIILSIISLTLWGFFRLPILTLTVNIFIDFLGFLPTFQKSYQKPTEENRMTWILFFLGSILNLIALEEFSISIALYPIYMFFMDLVMIFLLFRRVTKTSKIQYAG